MRGPFISQSLEASESELWISDAETLSKVKGLKTLQFHFIRD